MMLLAVVVTAAACGGPAAPSTNGGHGADDMADMPGMGAAPTSPPLREAAPTGTGLAAGANGYTLALAADGGSFHIDGPGGRPVTRYQTYESELMQFDVIRSDLTGYRHVDAAMRQDGTWSVPPAHLSPGTYRGYATFAAPDASAGTPQVYQLSRPFTIPGTPVRQARAAPAGTTTVGGYRVTVTGRASAGRPTVLHLRFTKDGRPVPYFQRYLDGYAHVTAFHAGDLALAHIAPATGPGGNLTARALFPESGTWRLFVLFRTTGAPLTAEFTVRVG
jgi:hypothetical protein